MALPADPSDAPTSDPELEPSEERGTTQSADAGAELRPGLRAPHGAVVIVSLLVSLCLAGWVLYRLIDAQRG